jgi:hypothetical protein
LANLCSPLSIVRRQVANFGLALKRARHFEKPWHRQDACATPLGIRIAGLPPGILH